MTAPQHNLVRLPDNVSFEQASRLGYLGTAYAALRKAGAGPGNTVLINGISGTLGLGAALIALGRGAARVFGTGRRRDLLARVKALASGRIEVLALEDQPIAEWARSLTGGLGVDMAIDCLGPGSPAATMIDAIYALRRARQIRQRRRHGRDGAHECALDDGRADRVHRQQLVLAR